MITNKITSIIIDYYNLVIIKLKYEILMMEHNQVYLNSYLIFLMKEFTNFLYLLYLITNFDKCKIFRELGTLI